MGAWFPIEEQLQAGECLVFVGDPIDYVSAHRYPALMHRPVAPATKSASSSQHRVSTPLFLYPRANAVLTPPSSSRLPSLAFDDLNNNVNHCRDRFPWKMTS